MNNYKPGDLVAMKHNQSGTFVADNIKIEYVRGALDNNDLRTKRDTVVITQVDAIHIDLMQNLNIEEEAARRKYRIHALAQRIYDLKKRFAAQGITATIETELETTPFGKHFARYYLIDRNDEVKLPECLKPLEDAQ